MATPVYLITGFLGSGKTTLLNSLLQKVPQGRKIAAIINEFGSVSIDGKLVKRGNYEVLELTSGCICCTLRVDIIKTLLALIADYNPDAIVIEATGLAIPKDIAFDINNVDSEKMYCNGIIGLVNCAKYIEMSRNFMIINAQLKEVTAAILNKTDTVGVEELAKIRNAVRTVTGEKVRLFEAEYGAVQFEKLFPAMFYKPLAVIKHHTCGASCGHDHGANPEDGRIHDHGHADADSTDGIKSAAFTTTNLLNHGQLTDFFSRNGERLLRAKGIAMTELGIKVYQYASDGLNIEDYCGRFNQSEMVLIATDASIDKLADEFSLIFS